MVYIFFLADALALYTTVKDISQIVRTLRLRPVREEGEVSTLGKRKRTSSAPSQEQQRVLQEEHKEDEQDEIKNKRNRSQDKGSSGSRAEQQ